MSIKKGSGQMSSLPAACFFVFTAARASGDGGELDDLRGGSELPVLYAPPVKAMPGDADRMVQVV